MAKKISTTQLAKKHGLQTKELFGLLNAKSYIVRNNDQWELTEKGSKAGGDYRDGAHGPYIVWPEDITLKNAPTSFLTATKVGKEFDLSGQKINHIFSELGWIKKSLKGWEVTEQGRRIGASQDEDKKSGVPFVRWPDTILASAFLKDTIAQYKGHDSSSAADEEVDSGANSPSAAGGSSFRDKFVAKHRATDGHFVRSKAEMLIDNWLYMAEIVHAYERKLPVEEELYSDFYIPTGKVYIEYWGYENDSKYLARKKEKQAIYAKYNFNLIELEDKDVQNLDDILPRLLLKHGVQAY